MGDIEGSIFFRNFIPTSLVPSQMACLLDIGPIAGGRKLVGELDTLC